MHGLSRFNYEPFDTCGLLDITSDGPKALNIIGYPLQKDGKVINITCEKLEIVSLEIVHDHDPSMDICDYEIEIKNETNKVVRVKFNDISEYRIIKPIDFATSSISSADFIVIQPQNCIAISKEISKDQKDVYDDSLFFCSPNHPASIITELLIGNDHCDNQKLRDLKLWESSYGDYHPNFPEYICHTLHIRD
jgi:hypothetical protein